MQAPPDVPKQKFQRPDAKTAVGKETIKVEAGTFPTTHYRDHTPVGTVDVWVSEAVPPLGLIKVTTTPEPKSGGADAPAIPPASMELTGTGTGAKPTITKPAKPYDPKGMTGGAPRAAKKHK
jgi:hypothetical protein